MPRRLRIECSQVFVQHLLRRARLGVRFLLNKLLLEGRREHCLAMPALPSRGGPLITPHIFISLLLLSFCGTEGEDRYHLNFDFTCIEG